MWPGKGEGKRKRIVSETSFPNFPKIRLKSPGKSGFEMIDSPNPLSHEGSTPALEIRICLIAWDCVRTEYSWSSCCHKGCVFKCFYLILKTLFLSLKRPIDITGSTAIWDIWLARDCMDCGPQISQSGEVGTESGGVRVITVHSQFIFCRLNKYVSLMCITIFNDMYEFD